MKFDNESHEFTHGWREPIAGQGGHRDGGCADWWNARAANGTSRGMRFNRPTAARHGWKCRRPSPEQQLLGTFQPPGRYR